ncbi:hypothetical protein KY290_002311 [Solanum tuberosum]|uniref:Uncharacterized protein n=1 Tax=Solanum tuberosum TaxID=4113 RepID=A0ABQ7WRM9_SOLTU|nr:hypothetical protein KY285_002196 [Solanum tuberosum]KAH0782713.1 hypothetical protein KY290_002311 [Solanum tuberosum]
MKKKQDHGNQRRTNSNDMPIYRTQMEPLNPLPNRAVDIDADFKLVRLKLEVEALLTINSKADQGRSLHPESSRLF